MNAPEVTFPNLGIVIPKLPKVAFQIGPFSIYLYGLCIVLGVAVSTWVALREAKRVGHNPDDYLDFLFYVLIFSLIGARLYYVIFRWYDYKDNLWEIFAFREGGLAIYGGVIAAFITGIAYTRIKKLYFWPFADVCAPSLILGQAIGRWGNFFNREVFGHYTEKSLFAMRYLIDGNLVGVIPQSVMDHVMVVNGARYIQVQPTFLYESFWNLVVFTIMIIYRRRKKRDGEIILMYLFGYGVVRFIVEGMRTDQLFLFGTGVPVSQLLSAALVAASAVVFVWRRRHAPAVIEADEKTGENGRQSEKGRDD